MLYTDKFLLEEKLVYRITIRMDKLPARLTAIIRLPQTDIGGFNAHRNEFFTHLINNPKTPINAVAQWNVCIVIVIPYINLFSKSM